MDIVERLRLPYCKDGELVADEAVKDMRTAADEIERLRAALKEIAAMRREDLSMSDGSPEDNLAAHHARIALELPDEE